MRPSFAGSTRLPEKEDAGNAGCTTHPQPCVQVKKARKQVTTGTPEHAGIPRAMVCRLIRALPGVPGLLATVARGIITRKLDPSVGGSGPHDFAVRAATLVA